MSYQEQLSQWEETLSRQLPQLSKPQVAVLACWSYALVMLKSVGMTQALVWLAMLLGGKVDAWRQKLREWCYDAQDKKGDKRAELEVSACFAPELAVGSGVVARARASPGAGGGWKPRWERD